MPLTAVGSGVVEAACKMLVSQRLELSGMRWGRGAQAILTTRGWDQSDRFDDAWALLAAHFQVDVHVLAKVIPHRPPLPEKPRRSRTARRAGPKGIRMVTRTHALLPSVATLLLGLIASGIGGCTCGSPPGGSELPDATELCNAPGVRCGDGWQWELPLPGPHSLRAAYSAGPDDLWVVSYGVLGRFDGANWSFDVVAEGLGAIHGSAADDVWAVGDPAVALHYDGAAWSRVPIDTGLRNARGVWVGGKTDAWLVGDGLLMHWDGNTWMSAPIDGVDPLPLLSAVWGSGPTDVWAASPTDAGSLYHFDGVSWSVVANWPRAPIFAIWGSAANDVWAAGFDTILHFDGTAWSDTRAIAPGSQYYLYGLGGTAGNVWAVGSAASDPSVDVGGVVLTNRSGQWERVDPGIGGAFYGVWGARSDRVWIVGEPGRLLFTDGSQFWRFGCDAGLSGVAGTTGPLTPGTIQPDRTAPGLWSVWANSSSDVLAVGDGPTVMHYDGAEWSEQLRGDGSDNLMAVWASGPTEAWAGGAALYHNGGNGWSPAPSFDFGPFQYVMGMWGSGPNDVWAVGSLLLAHFDGNSWTLDPWSDWRDELGNALSLDDIWGTAPNDVWAVGNRILHFDGAAWVDASPAEPGSWRAVWASGPNDVWVAGWNTLLHFDGVSWQPMRQEVFDPDNTTLLEAVWGSGPDDVWVAGHLVLWHYNGSTWVDAPAGCGYPGRRIHGADGHVWVVGGGIAHRRPQ